MKRILIISAFYTPKIHVASNRATAMAKYFKKSGYEVTVLTEFPGPERVKIVNNEGSKIVYLKGSHFLNRETFFNKSSFFVHKLKAFKNKVLNFFVVDDTPGFFYKFKKFFTASLNLEEKQRFGYLQSSGTIEPQLTDLNWGGFDFIFSTYAPLSSHLIALKIKKRFSHTIWIADFRDEMSFLPGASPILKWLIKKKEKEIITVCDILTTISQPLLEQFRSVLPKDSNKLFLEVRNGFDFDLHKEPEQQKEIFNIIYTGTFYGLRNPFLFFEALKKFTKKYPQQKIQFSIYGGNSSITIPNELISTVKIFEKIKYELIRQKLIESSCLLLIEPSEGRVGGYTGKLFDYLAINRPVLAYIKKDDVAAELINQCRAGYIDEYYDVDTVLSSLEKVYQNWVCNRLPLRNWDLIIEQSRENQIKKLIYFVDSNASHAGLSKNKTLEKQVSS